MSFISVISMTNICSYPIHGSQPCIKEEVHSTSKKKKTKREINTNKVIKSLGSYASNIDKTQTEAVCLVNPYQFCQWQVIFLRAREFWHHKFLQKLIFIIKKIQQHQRPFSLRIIFRKPYASVLSTFNNSEDKTSATQGKLM